MKSSRIDPSVFRRWSLPLLCAVQSCERFAAFLAMLPLFVLYAQERHGIVAPQALLILALFQTLARTSAGCQARLDFAARWARAKTVARRCFAGFASRSTRAGSGADCCGQHC